MGKSITFVNGDSVGYSISGIENDTGGPSGSVKGEDGLDSDVESRGVESFEHDLSHLLSVDLGVERSFGEEDGVLFRCNSKLVVELNAGGSENQHLFPWKMHETRHTV